MTLSEPQSALGPRSARRLLWSSLAFAAVVLGLALASPFLGAHVRRFFDWIALGLFVLTLFFRIARLGWARAAKDPQAFLSSAAALAAVGFVVSMSNTTHVVLLVAVFSLLAYSFYLQQQTA